MIPPASQAETLFVVASITNLTGWIVYLRNQWSGHITSRPVGWLVSMLLVLNGVISSVELTRLPWAGAMYAAGLIPCAIALALASRHGFYATQKERYLIAAALLGLLAIHGLPGLVVTITALYYGVTYTVFAINVIKRHAREHPLPWMIWSGAAVAQLYAIGAPYSSASILPATNLVCWITVAGLAQYRRIYP